LKKSNGLKKVIARLQDRGIQVALFIEPEPQMMDMAKMLGATAIEIHTGTYANATTAGDLEKNACVLKSGRLCQNDRT